MEQTFKLSGTTFDMGPQGRNIFRNDYRNMRKGGLSRSASRQYITRLLEYNQCNHCVPISLDLIFRIS